MFGEVLFESPELPWSYSDYYEEELGSPVTRTFFFFQNPVDPSTLADIKLGTNALEEELATDGKRNINLDPGYLTPYNVVLASTKNYSHRIALAKGIFAEVTLLFRDGAYRPHLFTYADYASEAYRMLFERARKSLRARQRE